MEENHSLENDIGLDGQNIFSLKMRIYTSTLNLCARHNFTCYN